jgi:hypothetical protein
MDCSGDCRKQDRSHVVWWCTIVGRNILEFSIPPDILELTNLVLLDLSK